MHSMRSAHLQFPCISGRWSCLGNVTSRHFASHTANRWLARAAADQCSFFTMMRVLPTP